uniref:DNA topoisomerase n=1 Tax=Nucleocytoviricota sp. TaxID=2809609 RepID=A0A9E8G3Z4_9VIRU|nr:DNA topoisomerase I [Nucleocytoviricota sp.]UZT29279.1 DNA topoisomerase I [Nucleocytoviricota sp.]
MSKTLIIVESPAKCKKIEKFLGENYKCIGSFGHLTELNKLEQINFNDFSLKYVIINSKKDHVSKIKKEIQNSKEVIIATDDDREGEAIGWHICDLFNLNVKNTKRILFNEITENALKKAVANPTTLNLDLVNAQKARQVLDLIVGYKITPLLWKTFVSNTKNALSSGRCQTPALNLVYDNYLELKDNNGERGFNINGYFTKKSINFSLTNNFKSNNEIETFLNESIKFNHIYKQNKIKNSEKTSPEPLTTSSLQQQCNNNNGYSPKDTMNICQKLYEAGLITYMRTDSKNYSKDFINSVEKYIIDKYDEKYFNKENNYCNEERKNNKTGNEKSKDIKTQEAHESIRPTKINVEYLDSNEWSPKERNIYRLIWKISIQSLMTNYKCKILEAIISSPIKTNYTYNAELSIFLGFKIIDFNKKENDEMEKIYNYFKSLNEMPVNYNKIIVKELLHNFKQHYNEAKLVQLLEKKGIGRPSTFASLVEKIQARGYVKRENIDGKKLLCKNYELVEKNINIKEEEKEFGNEKNKLVIQDLGILVIEYLKNNFSQIFNYDYTKSMEEKLDLIANNEESYFNLLNVSNKELDEVISNISIEKHQFKIDKHHTYLIGKNGPVIKKIFEGKTEFLSIKDNINLDYLKKNEGSYSIDELIDSEKMLKISESKKDNILGNYKDMPILLKKGKFGLYLEYDKKNYSLPKDSKYAKFKAKSSEPKGKLTLDSAINIIQNSENNKDNTRIINESLSIRNGNYGYYVMYKTKTMRKPLFYSLKDCELNIELCEESSILNWVNEKYKTDF